MESPEPKNQANRGAQSKESQCDACGNMGDLRYIPKQMFTHSFSAAPIRCVNCVYVDCGWMNANLEFICVVARRYCEFPNCTSRPTFRPSAQQFISKQSRCYAHKRIGDESYTQKHCPIAGCTKTPSFVMAISDTPVSSKTSTKRELWCKLHAPIGAIYALRQNFCGFGACSQSAVMCKFPSRVPTMCRLHGTSSIHHEGDVWIHFGAPRCHIVMDKEEISDKKVSKPRNGKMRFFCGKEAFWIFKKSATLSIENPKLLCPDHFRSIPDEVTKGMYYLRSARSVPPDVLEKLKSDKHISTSSIQVEEKEDDFDIPPLADDYELPKLQSFEEDTTFPDINDDKIQSGVTEFKESFDDGDMESKCFPETTIRLISEVRDEPFFSQSADQQDPEILNYHSHIPTSWSISL